MGDFKGNLDLNMLGVKRNEAIRIFDKTGWLLSNQIKK